MYDLLLMNIVRDNALSSSFMDCLGQHSIASYLSLKGYGAKVFSGKTISVKRVIEKELKKGIKCVGLYTSSDNISIVFNIIKWIKKNFNLKVIVGGPEAVSCDEIFMRNTGCDCIVENEGEEPIKKILDYYIYGKGKLSEIPNLKYIDQNDMFCKNINSYFVKNLDEIPFPNYCNSLNKKFRKSGMVGILTGRGCPFNCTFCYEGANAKNVRFRSIENVMAEIDYIAENNSALEFINIYDDTFTLDLNRVYKFCEEISLRNINWVCEGHISNIVKHPEMIGYMVKSGLVGMQIGIESGSDKVLKAYNKHTTAADILETVRICKEQNLPHLTGNFIIGGAFENYETFNESLNLAKEMVKIGRGMFECRTVFLSPYPNTRISQSPEKFGLHIDYKLMEHMIYTMHNPVMSTDELSVVDIIKLKEKFTYELNEVYYEQAGKCTRAEVENMMLRMGKLHNKVYVWYDFYEKYEHIRYFMHNALTDKIPYSEDYFPIRTFCDPNYVDKFGINDIEKEFLLFSDGKLSIKSIGEKLCLKPNQIRKLYHRMYDRCFVYLSVF